MARYPRVLFLCFFAAWLAAASPGLSQAKGEISPADAASGSPEAGATAPNALSPDQAPAQTPSGTQTDASAQPPGSTVQAPLHHRPHLIELTSQNWHPLSSHEKFGLFWQDMISWETHLSLAANAAISFATDGRDDLGYDTSGYFRRYGLNVADEANGTFFQAFLFPTLFHEDPRYIPLEKAPVRRRVAYALSRVIITRTDSGENEVNKSLLLGTLASSAICNFYYDPAGGGTGAGATFTRAAINLGSDAAFNLFKEFWPDFARKVRLNLWIRNIVRTAIRDEVRVD